MYAAKVKNEQFRFFKEYLKEVFIQVVRALKSLATVLLVVAYFGARDYAPAY